MLSNGFAVGCLITIILHLLLPQEHDQHDPDDVVRSPEADRSFTTHPASNRTPAAYYNQDKGSNGNGDDVMKPVEMSHMDRSDDTAHPVSAV